MRSLALAFCLVLVPSCRAPGGGNGSAAVTATRADGPRILCVTAHPDDEIAFAGTLYKTATHLGGVCDVAVITNGEGGFKYSTLAEPLYGLELTDEDVGRRHLPAIRQRELRAGLDILRVRDVHFLGQRDHRYTQDPLEVLGPDAQVWDLAFVRQRLQAILAHGDYDFVLTLAPTVTTHGHHQAAAVMALEAVGSLPLRQRPVTLCARSFSQEKQDDWSERTRGIEGFPVTRVRPGAPFVFDRRQPFGHRERLDYRIVANWAIAEHKSQGTMQLLVNRGDEEHYFLFEQNPDDAAERTRVLFEELSGQQFEAKTYEPSAGTNAAHAPAR